MEGNTTPAENRTERKNKICPICGARNKREQRITDFNFHIVEFLRENNITKRDSCIQCVEKHVGYARRLYFELLTLNDKTSGSAELNHIDIIGELRAATEEASEYPELYEELLDAERGYRYEGKEPDWYTICEMIAGIKNKF